MFIIKPTKPEYWAKALFILSYYHVRTEVYSNGENLNGMYMAVMPFETDADDGEKELRMAEAAFQCPPGWHTEKGICEVCKDEQPNVCSECDCYEMCPGAPDPRCSALQHNCGHLVFNEPINGAF